MKINTSTHQRIWRSGLITVALVVAGLSAYLFFARDDVPQVSPTVKPAPSRLSEEDAANKKAFIDSQDEQTSAAHKQSQEGFSTSSTDPSANMTAVQDADEVVVRTELNGIGDGSCILTIINGTKTYRATVDVIYQPAYSTCAGFSIDSSELGAGNWQLSLSATSLSKASASADTTLEVK